MKPDALRISEALPQPTGPRTYTDGDVFGTCPDCKTEFSMLNCNMRFQSGTSTYSCPTDGEVLAIVRQRDGGGLKLEAMVDIRIAPRSTEED